MNDELMEEGSVLELLATKERLIYHLLRVMECAYKGEWRDEGHKADELLAELGYADGSPRRKFMLESGEPGLSAQWVCANCEGVNMAGATCVRCQEQRRSPAT